MKARFKVGDIVGISTKYIRFPANGKTGKVKSILEFPNGDIYYCIKTFDGLFNVCIRECEAVPPMTSEEVIASAYPHRAYMDAISIRNYMNEDIRRTQEMMDAVDKMIHEREERKMSMTPKKIMRNGPATIVFWEDGTKTVVKKMPSDKDDIYAAFCAAFTKKHFGSNEKVKAVVDSLTRMSEEEINDRVIKFNDKFDNAFSIGCSALVNPAKLGYNDEHAFNRFLMELSGKGFAAVREGLCGENAWSVRRNDAKFIEWIVEHMSSTGRVNIDPKFTNGNMDRMNAIAKELTKDGFKVTCKFRTDCVGGFPYIISGYMEVSKK